MSRYLNTLSRRFGLCAAALAPLLASAAAPPPVLPGDSLGYADMVDLALAAPVVAHVTLLQADRLRPEEAGAAPAGEARFFVSAHVDALLRGPALPETVSYLADVPLDPRGRVPRLKGADALLFATPVAGKPDSLRLLSPDAQRPWTSAAEARVHAILAEALGGSAPPRVTGIGNVFHVPGSLPGESETQIFVKTADGRPISLAVERRPGQQPSWAVALGDIIDESAAPPRPETLLWYQLACGLPRHIPSASLGTLSAEDGAAAQADYQVVLDGLGACGRARTAQPGSGSEDNVTPTAAQSG